MGWMVDRRRLLFFLSIVGPGIITANVDNDAGGITTYSLAGAHYGYGLLWSLIPITVLLIMVQEMVARLGVVTGKGLSDLIREEFGVKTTFLVLLALLLTNLGNIMRGICRPGRQPGNPGGQPLYSRSRRGISGLVFGGQRQLSIRGKGFSGGLHDLSVVCHLRFYGPSGLGRGL